MNHLSTWPHWTDNISRVPVVNVVDEDKTIVPPPSEAEDDEDEWDWYDDDDDDDGWEYADN